MRRRERVDDDGDDYVYWYRAINRISVHQRMDWQKLCADQYLSLMTRRTIKCYLSNSLAFVLSSQSVLLHLTAFPCLVTQSITTATVIWTGCSLSLCIVVLSSYAAAAAAFAAPPIKGDLMTFSTFHCYNINLIAATATVYILHCTVKPLYGDINSPI